MLHPGDCTLYSGGAPGAESFFGEVAERYSVQEVNFSFDRHHSERARGLRVLTKEELALKDVSLSYVSRLLRREYTRAPLFRKVLQSICWQVSSGHATYVIGAIMEDGTVRGGTGWGAEFAKLCNKPLLVFDQARNAWFRWHNDSWLPELDPVISKQLFTGTGTRFLQANSRKAIEDLFARSFKG